VVLSWPLWPLLAFLVDVMVRFSVSTSRGCSVEGCDFTPSYGEWAIYLLPPLFGTFAWWRWRQKRRRASR